MKYKTLILTMMAAIIFLAPQVGFSQHLKFVQTAYGPQYIPVDDSVVKAEFIRAQERPYYVAQAEPKAEASLLDVGCDSCGSSCYWGRIGISAVWGKGRTLPALATTSNAADVGIIGNATTQILLGGSAIGSDLDVGGFFEFGKWLDDSHTVGFGVKYFGLEDDSGTFNGNSLTFPVLALPIINAQSTLNDAVLISSANASGSIAINGETDITNIEAYLKFQMKDCGSFKLHGIGGYHYSQVYDEVSIQAFSVDTTGAFLGAVGNTRTLRDFFDASNDFHGGSLGFESEWDYGCWSLSMLGKVSIGNMRQTLAITGSTLNTSAGAPATFAGGVYSQPTNIGIYKQDEFVYIPEAAINLTYHTRRNVDLTLGYSFIYWSSVVMAGDQIDSTVNLSQTNGNPLFGPANPAVNININDTDFWLQGLNFSATWNY